MSWDLSVIFPSLFFLLIICIRPGWVPGPDEVIYRLFLGINNMESSIDAVRVVTDSGTSVGMGSLLFFLKLGKEVAVPPERVESKVYFTPMPLHSTGVAIAGTVLLKSKGEGKHKREGPCIGTKGFRAPENQLEPKVLPNFESFIVKEEEGSGREGTVYRAQRKNDGATIAIKCRHANANRHHVYNVLKMLKRFGYKYRTSGSTFDIQFLTSTKLRDWCKLITRRPDFHETLPRSLFDLVDKCLTVNPRVRISAEEALRHEFFAPCHMLLRKQRMLRPHGLTRISAEEALRHEFFTPCHVLLRKQRMLRPHGLTSLDSATTIDGSLAASNKFD